MTDPENIIAFQGVPGAYSHMSCAAVKPEMTPLACASFEEMILSVQEGRAGLAMVPVENSIAGRVADIHHLLPESGLFIIAEHFQPVNHQLLAPKGGSLETLVEVHSHAQGLAQCRKRLHKLGLRQMVHPDTAGAAKDVASWNDPRIGAIASALAGEIYGLDVLVPDAEDAERRVALGQLVVLAPAGPGPAVAVLLLQRRAWLLQRRRCKLAATVRRPGTHDTRG